MAQTKVIAHRGYWTPSGSAQNSLASLEWADRIGVYGSEFDVQMTRDGVLVVNHDATLFGVRIETADFSTLKRLRLLNGEPLPTLESYLKKAKKLKTKMRLILEIKPHRDPLNEKKCVEKTVEMVKKYQLEAQTDYISFSLKACEQLVRLRPTANVAYLNGDLTPQEVKDKGMNGMDYEQRVLRQHPEWMAEARRLGLSVNVWTVNADEDLRHFVDLGVDFITTNRPVEALKIAR